MDSLEAKFRKLELEIELRHLKQQMSQSLESVKLTHEVTQRYYQLLGLKPGASLREIKQAYRYFVKKWHPDLFLHQPILRAKAQEKLTEVNEAYKALSSKLTAIPPNPCL